MSEGSNWPEEVKPLDVDGVGAIATGTELWLAALVALVLFRNQLAANDADWWIWVAATGAALGVPGLWYTRRRRSVYRRAQEAQSTSGESS